MLGGGVCGVVVGDTPETYQAFPMTVDISRAAGAHRKKKYITEESNKGGEKLKARYNLLLIITKKKEKKRKLYSKAPVLNNFDRGLSYFI